MAVEIVSKKKAGLTCAECGATPASADECSNCGSDNIKKSLVIVRKAVGDEDEDLDAALEVEDEVEEDEDLDDEDLDEEDEEDSDEEDEEEAEEDEDVDEPAPVGKSIIGLEALNIATAFVSDVQKCFKNGEFDSEKYEETMTEFNNVFDSAADTWASGSAVSKSSKKSHLGAINKRVSAITKEEGKKMPRPKNVKFDDLPDEVKDYITELEGGEVEKRVGKITKRDELPEDVQKTLKAADEIIEASAVKHWEDIAKGYKHFTGDKSELAKSLRKLHETDQDAYETLKKTLDAAEEGLSQSEVFKTHGGPGGGEPNDRISKRMATAEQLVKDGKFETVEKALVSLMDGADYTPTNS